MTLPERARRKRFESLWLGARFGVPLLLAAAALGELLSLTQPSGPIIVHMAGHAVSDSPAAAGWVPPYSPPTRTKSRPPFSDRASPRASGDGPLIINIDPSRTRPRGSGVSACSGLGRERMLACVAAVVHTRDSLQGGSDIIEANTPHRDFEWVLRADSLWPRSDSMLVALRFHPDSPFSIPPYMADEVRVQPAYSAGPDTTRRALPSPPSQPQYGGWLRDRLRSAPAGWARDTGVEAQKTEYPPPAGPPPAPGKSDDAAQPRARSNAPAPTLTAPTPVMNAVPTDAPVADDAVTPTTEDPLSSGVVESSRAMERVLNRMEDQERRIRALTDSLYQADLLHRAEAAREQEREDSVAAAAAAATAAADTPNVEPLVTVLPDSETIAGRFDPPPPDSRQGTLMLWVLVTMAVCFLGLALYAGLIQPALAARSASPPPVVERASGVAPRALFTGFLYLAGAVLMFGLFVPAFLDWLRADAKATKRCMQVALLYFSAGLGLVYMRIRLNRYVDPFEAVQLMSGAVGIPATFAAILLQGD